MNGTAPVTAPVTVISGPAELSAAVGSHLGRSPWITVGPDLVGAFHRSVGHPDGLVPDDGIPQYQVLGLTNFFLPAIIEVRGFSMGVNMGTESIRFGPPARIGSRLRGSAQLQSATARPDGTGCDTVMLVTVEAEDREADLEPPCVVEARSRWIL